MYSSLTSEDRGRGSTSSLFMAELPATAVGMDSRRRCSAWCSASSAAQHCNCEMIRCCYMLTCIKCGMAARMNLHRDTDAIASLSDGDRPSVLLCTITRWNVTQDASCNLPTFGPRNGLRYGRST